MVVVGIHVRIAAASRSPTEASDPDEPSRAANGSVSDLPRAVVPADDRGYESEKRRSWVKDGCLHEDASDGNEGSGDWQPLLQN